VTCHPGKKNTGIEPHPAHAFPTAERFVVVASCTKQEEEEEKERGRVSKQLSMDEVDAGRDRATPASVRHDDDEPLIPISQEEEEADCRGSMLRLSFLLLLLLLQPLRVALRRGSAQECAFALVWVIDSLIT
jgi:hypothetical protein